MVDIEIIESIVGNINLNTTANYIGKSGGKYVVITFNTDSTPYYNIYNQVKVLKDTLNKIGISTRTTGYYNGLYFDLD